MFHKISTVTPLQDYKIKAQFINGELRVYNVAPLAKRFPVFNELFDTPKLFDLVQVDAGGLGIAWNDEIDLSSDEIWYN